ncbi:hypothetical protein [Kitasatospora sp. NPDC002965]|uniref:hypothetical protein n=1 Tax=Kitasatospora sp. NPDC002965 TaxID=3154775 RepID=UPI0033ADC957
MRSGIRTWVRGAGVALLVVAAAAPVAGATPAETQGRPGMIDVADLPPDSLTWMGGASDEPGGSYTPTCLWDRINEVPEQNTWSADFFTSETAAAVERVFVLPTEAEAVTLAESLRQYYAGCADRLRAAYPGDTVTGQDHGSLDVEEGATVGGVHRSRTSPWASYNNHLYGVGRDGSTVAVVEWESNWTQPDVPAFKETVRAAVNKRY